MQYVFYEFRPAVSDSVGEEICFYLFLSDLHERGA